MSKLDDIQTTCDNCEYAPALSETCKERIKDLFLELIDSVNTESDPIVIIEMLEKKVKDL